MTWSEIEENEDNPVFLLQIWLRIGPELMANEQEHLYENWIRTTLEVMKQCPSQVAQEAIGKSDARFLQLVRNYLGEDYLNTFLP
jgi:hypothetical protein